jgi:protein arginine kinase
MQLNEYLPSPAEASKREGPHHRIVMSSRVRLARNIAGLPFPGWAKKGDRLRALETIRPAVEALPAMRARQATAGGTAPGEP